MNTRNIKKKNKRSFKIQLPLWSMVFLLLISACVTQKKYDTALSEIARLKVDSTFQEYEVTDVSYEKDGVIYQQNKELIDKSYKMDSLSRMIKSQSQELAKVQTIIAKLEDQWAVNDIGGKLLIDLDDEVFFSSGSNDITVKGNKMIKELSNSIKDIQYSMNIWVIGHTDKQPFNTDAKDNWDLSSERSLAVVRALIANGVAPSSIVAGARSMYDPKFPDRAKSLKSKNRRTEIILVPDNGMDEVLSNLVKGS